MPNVYRNLGAVAKDTGGLWHQLEAQVNAQAAASAPAGMGLWGKIVTAHVGGVWDQFDNETMLLSADRLKQARADLWRAASDETLILPREALLPIWEAALAKTDALGAMDREGTLLLMRADADNLWSRSADETLLMSRATESVFMQQVRARDLSTYLPRRLQGYALKKLADARGETYWVLKNLRTDAYLRLTAEQLFLWNQMDGQTSVQDIAVAFMLEHGKLAITSLLLLLDQLQQKGFIAPLVDVYGQLNRSMAQRGGATLWRRLARRFANTEFAIGGIDGWVARSYALAGRWLFTSVVQWLMLAVIMAGGAVFVGLLVGLLDRDVALLGGAGAALGLVTLYILQFTTLMIHEWAHAIATKHYGREVRRGGFVLYMGMPAAFVDTTDIWMEPRRPRIVVSWAGPHSGFFLGGLASLALLAAPGAVAQGVLYQFALLTYLTSFMNLNPLLKLDGYYILMDWLEIPRLREKSLAFIGRPLRAKLRQRQPWTRDERIFAVFGVLSAVWTVIAVGVLAATAGGVLLGFLQTWLGLALLALAAIFFVLRWGLRRSRRRRVLRRQRADA